VGLKSKQRIEVVPNNYEDVDNNPQIPCEEVSVLHRVVVKNIMCSDSSGSFLPVQQRDVNNAVEHVFLELEALFENPVFQFGQQMKFSCLCVCLCFSLSLSLSESPKLKFLWNPKVLQNEQNSPSPFPPGPKNLVRELPFLAQETEEDQKKQQPCSERNEQWNRG